MSNKTVNRTVNIYIQSGEAQKALDLLIKKETKLKSELAAATDPKVVERLQLELKKLEEPIERAQKKLSGELTPSLRDTEKAATKVRQAFKLMSEEDEGFENQLNLFRQSTKELEEQRVKMGFLQRAMRSFWQEAKTVAAGVLIGGSIQGALERVKQFVMDTITGSAKIADELADIEKTTGLTNDQVRKLNGELSKMDTRTENSKLRQYAEEAGKLGKESVEDIKKFVREADIIDIGLGKDLGENAIIDIAKTSDIFKTEMLNMASAINQVGASSAASEAYSVDFLKRMAGTAPTVKLAADQVLGYSAALEIAGQTQEVAATALNTFFLDFVRGTESFGKAAGFAKGELTDLLNTKGTNEAFLQFLERLKQAEPTAAGFINKLKDLGIDGARGSNVLLALSNNIKGVREQQLIANEAIQSSTSIMDEFNKKNNNAGAEYDKLKKNVASFFASNTIMEASSSVVRAANNFINVLRQLPEFIESNRVPILTLTAGILLLNKAYIAAALAAGKSSLATIIDTATKKAANIITALSVAGQLAFGAAVDFARGRIVLATAATRIWSAVMALGAGPIGVLLVAISALAVGMISLVNNTKKLTAEQRVQAELSKRVADSTSDTVERMRQLTEVAKDNNVSLDTRKKALAELISISPEYLKGLTLENLHTAEGKRILDDYNKSLAAKANLQAKQALLDEKLKERNQAIIDQQKAQNNLPTSVPGMLLASLPDIVGLGPYATFDKANQKLIDVNKEIVVLQKDIDAANKQSLATVLSTENATGNLANGLNYLKTEKEKTSKAARDLKKDLEALEQELKKIARELSFDGMRDYEKQLKLLDDKYDAFRQRAQGNSRLLLLIEKNYRDELSILQREHYKKELERLDKFDAEQRKKEEERRQRALRLASASVPASLQRIGSMISRDAVAKEELAMLQQQGKQRMLAELRLLQEQERQELARTEQTEIQKELIREKYRQKRGDVEKDYWLGQVQLIMDFTKQALDIVSLFSDAKAEKENAELERDRKLNDRKKKNLEASLKAGYISQVEYDKKIQQIEKAQAAREKEVALKQFKRSQRMQLVQAAMNGAMAVTSTLAAIPGPLDIASLGTMRLIQIGLTLATTAAQMATIASQKPPEYARGGKMFGPSHSSPYRGLPVVDPITGKAQAFVEGGEGIINKKSMADNRTYTITGTPSQIGSSINALHGGVQWQGGAVLKPAWSQAKPMPMNFSAISQSFQHVKMYAAGGVMGAVSASSEPGGNSAAGVPPMGTEMLSMLQQLMATNQQLMITNQQLSEAILQLQANGVQAYVPLTSIEAAQARVAAIREDATLKA